MGWQKTFSLSRRAKGCHLVTDEVQAQIKDGLKGVKVSVHTLAKDPCARAEGFPLLGRHVVLVHVNRILASRPTPLTFTDLSSKHTSCGQLFPKSFRTRPDAENDSRLNVE